MIKNIPSLMESVHKTVDVPEISIEMIFSIILIQIQIIEN
jgi:hypothetical protein